MSISFINLPATNFEESKRQALLVGAVGADSTAQARLRLRFSAAFGSRPLQHRSHGGNGLDTAVSPTPPAPSIIWKYTKLMSFLLDLAGSSIV